MLAERRVVVKSLEEDLNDGQVLAMLVRKYSGVFSFWLKLLNSIWVLLS